MKMNRSGIQSIIVLALIPSTRADVQWDVLLTKSRELSMSGILGLVETDILFAEPGTEQAEIWRVLQGLVGIGCLRVVSRICRSPCWEILHTMYGIPPPEGVEAREFWLRQPSWTEMSRLGLSQEDTSYHRINQGSGPQLKVLWTATQLKHEQDWWMEEGGELDTLDPPAAQRSKHGSLSVDNLVMRSRSKSPLGVNRDALEKGKTPAIYKSRRGNCVSEGTTDKWFMDRWQCEVLAVAAVHSITVDQASELLTVAYFGHESDPRLHTLFMILVLTLTAGTFVMAELTDWSWIAQLAALSWVGYFTNRTACLRAWKFQPNQAIREETPSLLLDWPPSGGTSTVYIRAAVQSSGFCHLRALFSLPRDKMEAARNIAGTMQGRWRVLRSKIQFQKAYADDVHDSKQSSTSWLSYEVQSSWYGLVSTVEPDNVTLRSLSIVFILVNGLVLLLLGFGATTKEGWNAIVLGIFLASIAIAIFSRGRGSHWTMPEFQVVDLTSKTLPPAVWNRLAKRKDLNYQTETSSSRMKRAARSWEQV